MAATVTSHPLEVTSDNDTEGDTMENLTEQIDNVYLIKKAETTKEIKEVRDSDDIYENEIPSHTANQGTIRMFCEFTDNQEEKTEETKLPSVELRRPRENSMRNSPHNQVNIDCNRQSVQFTNSGDFSPVSESPDGQTPATPSNVVTNDELSSQPGNARVVVSAMDRSRKSNIDDDTLVIEDVPKTHLENFSKCLFL